MDKNKKTHAWGVASLILSIIGLLLIFAPYIGIFCSILAVVFYGIQKKHEHTGIATAGLVIGIIGIVINAIMLIFVVGLLALFGSGTYDDFGTSSSSEIVGADAGNNQVVNNNNEIPLEVMDLSCEYGDYGWIYAKGRVKNNGDREANFVKVNIDLYNGDKWVDSDFTYIRNTDLPAGATDSFENTWTDSITFTRCEAFVTYS